MLDLNNSFDLEKFPQFDRHCEIISLEDKKNNLDGFIAIHRYGLKPNLPSFGATRFWPYSSRLSALTDGLRLSKTMSYKAALAGLKYGGAKAVLIQNKDCRFFERKDFFKNYAREVNKLNGLFITGADAGLSEEDVLTMAEVSPFIVGAKSNPVEFTALGVFYAIQSAVKIILGSDSLRAKSFAVQGLGKVGRRLVEMLVQNKAEVCVADINLQEAESLKKKFPAIKIVSPEKIHCQKVDFFSPCATQSAATEKNIKEMNCRIILGGANCQLENESLGSLLHERGIFYVPDYAANAGGLISVVDEYENKSHNSKRVLKKVKKIKDTVSEIIRLSISQNKAASLIADSMVKKILNEN